MFLKLSFFSDTNLRFIKWQIEKSKKKFHKKSKQFLTTFSFFKKKRMKIVVVGVNFVEK